MRKSNVLQVIYSTCIVLTQASQLERARFMSARAIHPFMVCHFPGPTHAQGLPLAYSEPLYASLMSLCSLTFGARENLACSCREVGEDVSCNQNVADPNLWAATFRISPNARIPLPQYCIHGCHCTQPRRQWAWFEFDVNNFQRVRANIGAEGIQPIAEGFQPTEPTRGPNDGIDTSGTGTVSNSFGFNNDQPGWQNKCGNNCTSSKDCIVPVGVNGTCTCQAHSSQYQPGSGTVAFIAACLVTLGSNGKREEGLPCPCNNTYVSYSCCDAPNGLVWEPPKLKLGKLLESGEL